MPFRFPHDLSGTTPETSRTKAGSRSRVIVRVVHELSRELGRGVSMTEVRESFERLGGCPPGHAIMAEMSSLVRRGVLVAAGGRRNRTLYALPGHPYDGQHADDDALVVLDALRTAFRRHGRAVTTREVSIELEQVGWTPERPNANAVRGFLGTWARARTRGYEGMRAPQVLRHEVTTATGSRSTRWAPAGETVETHALPAGSTFHSATDAFREAVGQVQSLLGHPPTHRDLRWWLESGEADPAIRRVLGARRFGACAASAVNWDRGKGSGPGLRVHALSTPFTCHGGGDRRYALGEPSPRDQSIACIQDMLVAYRPADERQLDDEIIARAMLLDAPALSHLGQMRILHLAGALRDAAGDHAWADLAQAIENSMEIVSRWGLSTGGKDLGYRRALIEDGRRQWAELRWLGGHTLARVLGTQPTLAGEAGTVSWPELEPWLAAARKRLDLTNGKHLLAKVRRFRAKASAGSRRLGTRAPAALSDLDRPEAFSTLFGLFTGARTTVLIANAMRILGHVVRDAGFVRSLLLDGSLEGAPAARRATILALGLLGEAVDAEEAVPDRSDADDTAAWVLSIVIARGTSALPLIERADRRAMRPAREVTDTAMARLERGHLYSVIG